MRRAMRLGVSVGVATLPLLFSTLASAKIITVSPADGTKGYTKIESAVAGDEVVIAPGTYKYRVYLQTQAPANNPIVIRAQDPANPPVWDLNGTLVEDAPGSYTAPDRGRGCWQVIGNNYHISGIVFTNCRGGTPGAGAGMRYYGDAQGLVVSGCVFRTNDNGLTGGSLNSEATAEFCEFDRNGNTAANPPTHNVYVYAGTFAMRYSFSHDATQGLDLHCRAQNATIEYNWLARGTGTEVQFDSPDSPPAGAYTRTIMFRGNVIVQAAAPANNSKVITLYNDEANTENIVFSAVNNTLVGNGAHAAFVQLANSDGTVMSASLSNNILAGTSVAFEIDDAAHGTVSGANNWLTTGTVATGLTGSVFGTTPGFTGAGEYTITPASACVGAASQTAVGLPTFEYYKDEVTAREYRVRATAKDIGAFEHSTTGPGLGSDGDAGTPQSASDGGAPTKSDGGTPENDGGTGTIDGGDPGTPIADDGGEIADDATTPSGDGATDPAPAQDSSGCSCRTTTNGASTAPGLLGGVIILALAMARRARGSRTSTYGE